MKAAACNWCSTRHSAAASTRLGAWRCASDFAVPSTWNYKRRRPTTGLTFLWPSSTVFRWPTCSAFCIRLPWVKCWSRQSWLHRFSRRAGAGILHARSSSNGFGEERRCRRRFSACELTICWPPFFPMPRRVPKISKPNREFRTIRSCARS